MTRLHFLPLLRRLLAVLLMLALPLQAPLAAVLAADAEHAHAHVHALADGQQADHADHDAGDDGQAKHDHEGCDTCHCSAPPTDARAAFAATADQPLPAPTFPAPAMPAADRPERPKWTAAA